MWLSDQLFEVQWLTLWWPLDMSMASKASGSTEQCGEGAGELSTFIPKKILKISAQNTWSFVWLVFSADDIDKINNIVKSIVW